MLLKLIKDIYQVPQIDFFTQQLQLSFGIKRQSKIFIIQPSLVFLVCLFLIFVNYINKRVIINKIDQIIRKSHYKLETNTSRIIIMNKPTEISEFYGVEVSDYDIKSLRNKQVNSQTLARVNQSNAHIYAHAYQNGYNVPSLAMVEKTIKKNSKGVEAIVSRLDRVFQSYRYNLYDTVFKKQKKIQPLRKKNAKTKKTQAFKLRSPEQIVIKCARQAYARQILSKQKIAFQNDKIVVSQSQQKRKQHQKQRRLERKLILKTYKYLLVNIFGNIIFSRGWRVGREQLKEKLQLPDKYYDIKLMKNILICRQKKAIIDRQLFYKKNEAYQKQKLQRLNFFRHLRTVQKNNLVRHKQETLYELKREYQLKSKAAKVQGERLKKSKRRKMEKKNIYHRQTNNPNKKEIKKQVNQLTLELEEIDECQEKQFHQVQQTANVKAN